MGYVIDYEDAYTIRDSFGYTVDDKLYTIDQLRNY